MCPLLATRQISPYRTLQGLNGKMCERLHISLVKKSNVAKNPMALAIWGPGHSVLSFVANRSSFLIGELLLSKLSEAVVVQGNAPHDRP